MSSMKAPSLPTVGSIVSRTAGGYAVAGGALALAGWLMNIPRLTDWDYDGISRFANTSVMSTCAGWALIFLTVESWWSVRVVRVLGLVVSGIACATIFEHLTGLDLGIDDLL